VSIQLPIAVEMLNAMHHVTVCSLPKRTVAPTDCLPMEVGGLCLAAGWWRLCHADGKRVGYLRDTGIRMCGSGRSVDPVQQLSGMGDFQLSLEAQRSGGAETVGEFARVM
jgi:hypothetical protein